MNILVIGYGSMGRRHAENAARLGHDVFAHDPFRAVQETDKIHRASSLSLVPRPDAIVIATPAETHAKVFDSIKHFESRVLIEKPLTLDLASAKTIKGNVRVGYNLRFHPHVHLIRARMTDTIRAAMFYVCVDGTLWPGTSYADALVECSHEIDLALHLLGPAECATASQSPDKESWSLMLSHTSGATSAIRISRSARSYHRGLSLLYHSDARAAWTWDAITTRSCVSVPRKRASRDVAPDTLYVDELVAFLADDPMVCTLAQARSVLAICDAARAINAKSLMF